MNYILIGLAIALAASLAGNGVLGAVYLSTRDDLVQAKADRDQARGAAKSCSESVDKLQSVAAERDREAVRARTKAESMARGHQARAQQILATPPADPADDCRSASLAIDNWLQGRVKP